ncbi:MAG: prepilin-type N-terminal cleavage/methylation domain-containing protein [Chthoniobacteraceae bacterium]
MKTAWPFFIAATRRFQRAFSLVEVTISLGIMAFVLAGITGLMSGSCTINRAAANDSALTQITRNVVESLRGQSLDDLMTWSESAEAQRTFYFAEDGSPLDSSGASAPQSTLYRCVVTADADPDTQSATATGSATSGTVNMVKLHLEIAWPVSAPTPSKKQVYVQLARY